MVAETWLYNPWVVAIGSGILLILFEEIISAYKEKKVYHRPRWQRTEVRCFLFYKTNLLLRKHIGHLFSRFKSVARQVF